MSNKKGLKNVKQNVKKMLKKNVIQMSKKNVKKKCSLNIFYSYLIPGCNIRDVDVLLMISGSEMFHCLLYDEETIDEAGDECQRKTTADYLQGEQRLSIINLVLSGLSIIYYTITTLYVYYQ